MICKTSLPTRGIAVCCAMIVTLWSFVAAATDRQAIDRNLLQQQQQSDGFALRSRQASEALRFRSQDPGAEAALQAQHAAQRRRQQTLHDQHMRRLDERHVMPDQPAQQAARRAERARMQQESAAQLQHFSLEKRDTERAPAVGEWGPRLNSGDQ